MLVAMVKVRVERSLMDLNDFCTAEGSLLTLANSRVISARLSWLMEPARTLFAGLVESTTRAIEELNRRVSIWAAIPTLGTPPQLMPSASPILLSFRLPNRIVPAAEPAKKTPPGSTLMAMAKFTGCLAIFTVSCPVR